MTPTCPKCKRDMYSTCGNKDCVCATRVPQEELSMKILYSVFGIKLSRKIGDVLWYGMWYLNIGYWLDQIHYKIFKRCSNYARKLGFCPDKFLIDIEECPYCGYSNTLDFWIEREYDEACEMNGVNSLTELFDKTCDEVLKDYDDLWIELSKK